MSTFKGEQSSSKGNLTEATSMENAADGKNVWTKCERAADELYSIRDTYFPVDPSEKFRKLQSESELCIKLLESIPIEQRKAPPQRAKYEFLRGKIMDVVPEYRKEAEDHLSKAVKLNPSFADAWLFLGNCIWKKGDLSGAKSCFNLGLSKGPNKNLFRALSMLERSTIQGANNPEKVIEESIQLAKDSLALDVHDGRSWYNLGNAYLTSFFAHGAWDHSKLQQSLKAYQNAEKDERMKYIPDLYYNCANVNRYLENYERALSGYEAAAAMDPGLNADLSIQKMVDLLTQIENLFKESDDNNRLKSLPAPVPSANLDSLYRKLDIDELTTEGSKEVALVGKVVCPVRNDYEIPLYYMVTDFNKASFILTVYGVHSEAIKEGDLIAIIKPRFSKVNVVWKNKEYDFPSIRVDFTEQLLVNGKHVSSHHSLRSSVVAQLIP